VVGARLLFVSANDGDKVLEDCELGDCDGCVYDGDGAAEGRRVLLVDAVGKVVEGVVGDAVGLTGALDGKLVTVEVGRCEGFLVGTAFNPFCPGPPIPT